MTSHPKDASRKLIDTMAANPKIARHFHLPLQSGSDRILREMNRHYDTAAYMELIDYMREKMPDISISTDIIVGFPGETDEDFGCTLDMVRRVRYDMLFSFIYSKRDGTPAAKMENHVPDEVKSARFARLIEAQAENALACNLPLEGKVVRVLVEGESKTDPEMFSGRTGGNKIVHIPRRREPARAVCRCAHHKSTDLRAHGRGRKITAKTKTNHLFSEEKQCRHL